jgi:protein-tyrosine phosphatase
MGSPNFPTKEKTKKLSLLFVCLGNICRSPAADGIMHKLVEDEGLSDRIAIDSAGTYGGHAGGLPDARMRQHAQRRGYELTHRARRVVVGDFDRFDLILAMDDSNYDDLMRLAPDIASQKKVHKMVSFCKNKLSDHVPDPYYEGAAGFEKVLDILEDACHGLLMSIKNKQL